ncbi:MAG: SUMF1/EgtB/PvdO family nonheme iron enzyme [Planctomycetes bacterium]|nr:SUMF1/EgtB/PvdO family nonheme iron enzyme [Planctomycetota bacterium]
MNASDYEIYEDQVLGQGGMGTICRGRQISLNRPVAIKFIRLDSANGPELVHRFRREAELLAQIVDAHVVQIFGAGEWRGRHFYAMELVSGEDLATLLRKGRSFTPEETLHIAAGVAQALRTAWKFRIVHRDIKPSNILLTPEGLVKVTDFGLAKSLRFDAGQSSVIAGTARYLSPEQGLGLAVDVRSDIYSLGVVLYELTLSRAPFEEEAATSLIYRHVHEDPVPPHVIDPTVLAPVEGLILRCIAKKPEDRYQTPEELLDAVGKVKSEVAAGAPTVKDVVSRKRRLVVLFSLLVVSLAAFAVVRAGGDGEHASARFQQEINLALGMGRYQDALRISEEHFGTESKEYQAAYRQYKEVQFLDLQGKAAEAVARKDWKEAVRLYLGMSEYSDESRKKAVTAGLDFCRDLLLGQEAEEAGNWSRAEEIYQRRLASPGEHKAYVEESLARVRAKLAEELQRKRDEAQRLFEERLAETHAWRRKLEWQKALDAVKKARQMLLAVGMPVPPEINKLQQELEAALAPRAGFVFIPSGPFPMGSDEGLPQERPRHQHQVQAAPFYIGLREVSRAEYARFLASPNSKSHESCPPGEPAGKDHTPEGWSPDLPQNEPVTGVDWFDATAYARWAGCRLPTEAEWEKAAAYDFEAEHHRKYPWGDTYDPNARDVSFFGCRGMGGTILEWTQSEFLPYPNAPHVHADFGKGFRVLRGGALETALRQDHARTSHRLSRSPETRHLRFGFRIVRDIP